MTMRIGDFETQEEIGRGGSARVFRARGPRGELVALKLLTASAAEEVYARFAREQRILSTLGEAEGFVPLLDCGTSPQGPFFIMPLVEGGTLRDRLSRGRLGTEETLQLGRMLATAIGWAHERGIVHRDLKPENILFTRAARPLIADLGIAKHFGPNPSMSLSESITDRGAFLGTPTYMAPEQMDCSKTVDARADVYALGAVLYECLCGRPPFEGTTIQEIVAHVTVGRAKPIDQVRGDTPLHLSHPIGIALLRDPEHRYANGFAFADALGARLPQRARLLATVREGPPRPRRRIGPTVLLAVGLAAVSAASLAVHRMSGGTPGEVARVTSVAVPKPNVPVSRGWSGEPLPPGVRPGADRPAYVFDTRKGLELAVVYVPPGDFFMGAINGGQHEKPLHTHPMPHGFYMARTEVTWGQYRAFCRATGHAEPRTPSWPVTDEHPVVFVSWYDATAFCDWAGLALPTEAEWEKASRGTDTRQWPWGDEWVDGAANILDASSPGPDPGALKEKTSDGWPFTAPAGSMPRGTSPYGAFDMAGNVWEWTADWYDPAVYLAYSNGRTDPPTSGTQRVIRGGSWKHGRFSATTSARVAVGPEGALDHIGFRPVLHLVR